MRLFITYRYSIICIVLFHSKQYQTIIIITHYLVLGGLSGATSFYINIPRNSQLKKLQKLVSLFSISLRSLMHTVHIDLVIFPFLNIYPSSAMSWVLKPIYPSQSFGIMPKSQTWDMLEAVTHAGRNSRRWKKLTLEVLKLMSKAETEKFMIYIIIRLCYIIFLHFYLCFFLKFWTNLNFGIIW